MFRIRLLCVLLACLCICALPGVAAAAEVDSGSVYCFSAGDFSEEASFTGICITGLSGDMGALRLGTRILQPGDILTAEQVGQMTFTPLGAETDSTLEVAYLPIYEDHVAASATVTLGIRGKENQPPVAEDSALETYKNLPNTAKLKVHDPEGEALTFTVIRQPKRGSVTVNADGSFTYTPKKNKVGIDSFVFTAADASGKVSREATVTVNILKPTNAPQYTDTVGRECRFAAEWMKHTGIFVGENLADNPCFSPDREVTRGEFVTMLVKALDIPAEAEITHTGYADQIPQWLQPYLAAAVRSGLTAGLPEQQTFGADGTITGAEVSVLLQNALDLTGSRETLAEEDSPAPVWAQASLAAVNDSGFSLEADAPLTRAAAAQLLYRAAKMEH